MAGPFAVLIDEMDAVLLAQLGDGQGDYLSVQGAVLATGLDLELTREAERLDLASGALDRAVTLTVQKRLLQPLDRKGAFLLDGKTWHIDGIASDDGHLIAFYVVP
ncbi:hypothetical protein [Azotobacter beijerinckii]|uniref:Uncharacterized protein n=1 Tax=Azotobacter beijerinckii TaxID=170623 RepID=A0A1I4G1U3_9GAMM|nr:hypothetical protein [Azotobacter beijerinckii]SFL23994.1 hypothetical protein SAMN04244574_03650 [Azotobacter beijerinckii]